VSYPQFVDDGRLRSAIVADTPLPQPNSEVLLNLVGGGTARALYGWLFRRDNPPTLGEIRLFVVDALGETADDVDRRLNELRRHFVIALIRQPGAADRYQLQGWAGGAPVDDGEISLRLQAQVLAPARCFNCGRTPKDDGVKLKVDHILPRAWGGQTVLENLQPLCGDCDEGKRDYYRTHDQEADRIRGCTEYPEPQRRIGELLKAFDGRWVRADLIQIVASAQEYQDDWQRRLRDLRYIGWDYDVRKRGEISRVWSSYRLTKSAPWPENIHKAIKAEETRRAAVKKAKKAAESDGA